MCTRLKHEWDQRLKSEGSTMCTEITNAKVHDQSID